MSQTVVANNEKIETACKDALEKFQKLGEVKYREIIEKLNFVLASYQYDGNPVGLYEFGEKALEELKAIKSEKPRLVSKKLISDLEKATELKEA